MMPGTLIVEAIGQGVSLLFSDACGKGINHRDSLALAAVNDVRFLVPVLPGHAMTMDINILTMTEEAALVEGFARVEDTVVTRGKLSFARKVA
jgi:3-hydroxyacyl-[acyl-carrier-protein] dehydratase